MSTLAFTPPGAGGCLALVGGAAPSVLATLLPRPRTSLIVADGQRPLLYARPVGEQIAAAVGGTTRAARDRAIDLLELAGCSEPHVRARLRPDRLTALDRQRAQLALALAQGPELLVAEDPAAGLDAHDSIALAAAITLSQAQLGFGLLLGTTDVGFAQRLVNEMLILDDAGRVTQRMRRSA